MIQYKEITSRSQWNVPPSTMRPSPLQIFYLISSLIVLAIIPASSANELEFAKPEDVGLSSGALREIETVVGSHLDQDHLAGAVTMIIRKGKIAHLEAHGWQDLEARIPMREDSIFKIYSMTKAIVSTGVMMLIEEGLFELDDPIENYIEELADLRVYQTTENEKARRAVTIRDLLRHTAGLTYGFFGNSPVDAQYVAARILDSGDDSSNFAKKLGDLPLVHHPGEGWNYSVAVDVQGVLIERVANVSLDRFLKERIFEPLNMPDTGFHVPLEKRHRFASTYDAIDNQPLRLNDHSSRSSFRYPPRFFSGGGGLVSTARDYSHFVQMLLNRGELFGKRILRPETVSNMTRNQLPAQAYPIGIGEPRPGVGFGLGFSVRVESSTWDPDGKLGEYGWGGAASTHFWVSPEDELAVITLEQTMPYNWNLEFDLKGLIYKAITD